MLHGAARPAIACNLLASCLLGREGRGRLGPCGRGAESMVSEVCRLPAVMAGGTADVIQDEAWQQVDLVEYARSHSYTLPQSGIVRYSCRLAADPWQQLRAAEPQTQRSKWWYQRSCT